MDGLSISTTEGMLQEGKTVSQLSTSKLRKQNLPKFENTEKSFATTLKEAVGNVNRLQKEADVLMQKLSTGKVKNIPEVMVAVEKADIALKLMVQVRNKVIDAYQEVMKMQV